ncbi:MAG: helix-turn-helix transcriptional regulator [Bacteriovoracaceae bacterium]|nr:helix-turn-helix transcriptional regulator [Bacteriovoracaceae bacterium]
MSIKKIRAIEYLEKKYGPLSLGDFIKSLRESDGITQTEFAEKLKISRANLCDIEKNRKLISPERSAKFAKILNYPENFFVKLALEDVLRKSKLKYHVELKAS